MSDDATESAVPQGWRKRTLPGYAGLIGPLWVCKEEAGWAYGLLATADHLNPAGVVHGGLLTSLLDHGISAVAWEALGRRACVSVQLDPHAVNPAWHWQLPALQTCPALQAVLQPPQLVAEFVTSTQPVAQLA